MGCVPASGSLGIARSCILCLILKCALSLRVFCMRLVVPALACACGCVRALCLSCACLDSACFLLVLCMRLTCRLASAYACAHGLCLFCTCHWLLDAFCLFDTCVWLRLLVLLLLLLHMMLVGVSPGCLHALAGCMLVVGCDPPARITTRRGIVPPRGVMIVWSRSGGCSWI